MRNTSRCLLRILTALLAAVLLAAFAFACAGTPPADPESGTSEEPSSVPSGPEGEASSAEPSAAESSEEVSDVSDGRVPFPEGAEVFTNLEYRNTGKMGDNDGPAYCVYSKIGYKKATMDVLISRMQINTVRKDRKFVNAYIFLGCDVYLGNWVNCFDAGLCWSGRNPAWHLFYNIYEPGTESQRGWFESNVKLKSDHDYRLILDTSEEDGKATITLYDLTDDREADSASFYVKHLLSSGANTAYLMDLALDYPDDVRKDPDGKKTDDWQKITMYNTDEGLYMRNILVENASVLPKDGTDMIPWDASVTNNRSLWPDSSMTTVDYPCTKLIVLPDAYDVSYRIDLDMNHYDETK